jgi:arsenite methyltransferase
MSEQKEHRIKEEVKQRYTRAVNNAESCCGPSSGLIQISLPEGRVVEMAGYGEAELRNLPHDAVRNSFGCGNPVSLAGIISGETVLDLGCGAGIDCFLAAEKVGPKGKVIGLDMTPLMIEKARANALKSGVLNVDFRLGDAESIPLENESVDWIISNCVINLSPNKRQVFREMHRVLKPGGNFSITDIMVEHLPWFLKRSAALYTSCVSGAIPEAEYIQGLQQAGFENVHVPERIVYEQEQLVQLMKASRFLDLLHKFTESSFVGILDRYVAGRIWSSRVVGTKR